MNSLNVNAIEANESDYLYVATSQIAEAGMGLFTAVKIYKEEIIAVFRGEILSKEEILAREAMSEDQYFMVLLDGSVLDCMHTVGFAKFANDATGMGISNFKNNASITLDENGNVCLVATSTIAAGKEIFCSYGKRYWKKHRK